jgi:O-antigen ligase
LTIGYGLSRVESRHRDGKPLNVASIVDPTSLFLAASVCMMLAALLVSLSRSGLVGGVVALAVVVGLSRRRTERRGRTWLVAGLAAVVAGAIAYVDVGAIATRVGRAMARGVEGRAAIWRDTWSMATDFWFSGVGVGAYERGMLVYQQGSPEFYYNHAHDEYLQLASEGGLLLAVPLAIVLAAAIAQLAARLAHDRTPRFWTRAGAVAAMAGLAVQSVWDTALRMPANAVLFAVLAAVALHAPSDPPDAPSRAPRRQS